jgi:hypothetical protein
LVSVYVRRFDIRDARESIPIKLVLEYCSLIIL